MTAIGSPFSFARPVGNPAPNTKHSPRAFALVTVLVILTLLSVIVTAFLSSIAGERATAHAFCNSTRAELAAGSAMSDGATLLKTFFQAYPDSATTWEPVLCSGSAVTAGTVLYFRNHANGAAFDPASDPLCLRPLMSGGTVAVSTGRQSTLTLAYPSLPFSHPDNSVDLNYPRFAGDTIGWIGSSGTGRLSVCVPWVYQTETTGTGRRPIARYAYWIEDESFKVNANCAGKEARGAQTAGNAPSQIPLQGLFAASVPDAPSDVEAAGIVDVRNQFPGGRFGDFRSLNQVSTTPNFAETAKFEGTAFSSALNLSRSGACRLNLNAVIQDSTDANTIRRQLDWLIAAIHLQLPNFGQRFYRLNPKNLNDLQVPATRSFPSANCTETYLQKTAANIRDYIDTDSQPTIVNNDSGMTIRVGNPTVGIEPIQSGTQGDNSALAIGKENVPYLDEYAIRVTLNEFSPAFMTGTSNSGATYDFDIDYYFEFWNMTATDIHASDLGPNPFLRVYNQAAWDTGGGGTSIPVGRAFNVPIPSGAVFPAGSATVITTDPNPNRKLLGSNLGNVIVAAVANDADRHYTGKTYKFSTDDTGHPNRFGYRVNIIGRSPGGATGVTLGATDYETRMLLGNDNGILESLNALPIARTGGNASKEGISIQNDAGDTLGSEDYFVRGGSLRSGPAPSEYADPRTNNEQLYLRAYIKNGDSDQTRYFNTGLDDAIVPAQSSLGALNFKADAGYSGSVDATKWPDCSSETPTPTTNCAPMVIANAPMKSIGELGHIFDPVRGLGSYSGANIAWSRGGGRTLTVGQPDPLWDKNSASPSREWAAWRLADLYCTTDDLFLDGRINLNGILRDDGAALKAVLYGYNFSTGADADPAIASQWLSSQAADEIVSELKARLGNSGTFANTAGPLAERGELSELPIFASGATLTGTDAATLYDRGREEVFRRMVELTTTRGCVFSIYMIGQALQQTPSGQRTVTGTCRRRAIVQLTPVWTPPLAADSALQDSDASDPDVTAARFRPPDAYQVKVLQVRTE